MTRIPTFLGIGCCVILVAALGQVSGKVHTPSAGSAERRLIVDSLREDYVQPHKGTLTFVVNYLKVNRGWAWIYAEPQSSDPSDRFGETNGFLFQKERGKWRRMNLPERFDDPNKELDYPSREDIRKIKRKYPSVPTDIFPVD